MVSWPATWKVLVTSGLESKVSYLRREQYGRDQGPFLESPDNISGPQSYFISARFTLKIQILLNLGSKIVS